MEVLFVCLLLLLFVCLFCFMWGIFCKNAFHWLTLDWYRSLLHNRNCH